MRFFNKIIILFCLIFISINVYADINKINEELKIIQEGYLDTPEKFESKIFQIYTHLKENKNKYESSELLDTMVVLMDIMVYYPDKQKVGLESSEWGIELAKLNNNRNIENFLFYRAMYEGENWEEPEKIKKTYKECIRYALLNENDYVLTSAYTYLADLYASEGNLKESLDYYRKAQTYYADPADIVKIKHGISLLFYKLGINELVIEKLLEAIDIMDNYETMSIPKKDYLVIIYQMLSIAYTKIDDFENALKYAEKNIKLSENYFDPPFEINAYLTYAGISAQLGNHKEAEKYIEKSEKMIIEGNYQNNHLLIYNYYFARYFNQLHQGNYKEAKRELKELEKYLEEKESDKLNNIYDRLSFVLNKLGEFEEALNYQKKYTDYYINLRTQKESLLSLFLHENYKDAELNTQIRRLEKEKLEKEKELTKKIQEKLEKEERLYQMLLIITLIAMSMVFIYIMYIKHQKISITDGLTNTFNRRYAVNKIESLMKKNKDFSLILFDLDYFKKINDTYGHDVGDEVLIGVSELIKNKLKKNEDLCRLGGEEFMVITEEDNFELAELLRKEIEKNKFEKVDKVTASFGVLNINKNNKESFNFIYNKLDKKLYEAKEKGRNKVVY